MKRAIKSEYDKLITAHVLERLGDTTFSWDHSGLSLNPAFTWEVVQANPDKPWDWGRLSENPSITLDIIQANPDKPWDWNSLSRDLSITREVIEANNDI